MFRRECKTGLVHRKFHNESESDAPIPGNNRLFNDAILYGDEIEKEEYFT